MADKISIDDPRQAGVALVAMFAVVVPMVVLIGASTTALMGHDQHLMRAITSERAFLAAESGVDTAVYRARVSLLDPNVEWDANMARGMRYDAKPVQWATDNVDNDDDGLIDEADENLVVVGVSGSYRGVQRQLSASFAFGTQQPPFGVPSPLYFEPSEKVKIKLKGKKDDDGILVSGLDRNLDGSRPAVPIDVPAVTVANDGLAEKLEDKLKDKNLQYLEGVGLVETRESNLDIDALVAHVESEADNWLDDKGERKLKKGSAAGYGDSEHHDYQLTYATGKMDVKGDLVGAGILVVEGDLKVAGDFRFDGLVIVRGKIELKKESAQINGAIIVRGKKLDKKTGLYEKADAKFSENTMIQYSTEALNNAASIIPGDLLPRAGAGGGGSTMSLIAWRSNYARSGFVAGSDVVNHDTTDGDGCCDPADQTVNAATVDPTRK